MALARPLTKAQQAEQTFAHSAPSASSKTHSAITLGEAVERWTAH